MNRHPVAIGVVFAWCLLTACSTQTRPADEHRQRAQAVESLPDPDIEPLSLRFETVDAVAISEEDYFQRISQREFEASNTQDKGSQLELAAKANEPDALGLVGIEENNVELDGRRLVRAKNQRFLSQRP